MPRAALKSRDTNIPSGDTVLLVSSKQKSEKTASATATTARKSSSPTPSTHLTTMTPQGRVLQQQRVSRLQPPRRFRSITPRADSSPDSSPEYDTTTTTNNHRHRLLPMAAARSFIRIASPVQLDRITRSSPLPLPPVSPLAHVTHPSASALALQLSPARPAPTPRLECHIQRLGNDCLLEIFQHCARPSTLAQLSAVCRHWHALLAMPHLWREVDCSWRQFLTHLHHIDQQRLMGSATRTAGPASKAPLVIPCHFSFIRTISISNDARCMRTFHWTTLNSPFVYLHSLCLDNMFWTDVLDLIVWMPKLQRLTSRATRFRSPLPAQVTLTCFTSVPKLEELRLDFTQDADHQHRLTLTDTTRSSHTTGTLTSTMARRRHASGPPRLPSSLKVLEISHLADFEEHLMADDLARGSHAADNDDARAAAWRRDWNGIESTLQQKYSVLLGLEQLKELTIGRCTTYTATIWRDYLRPCTRSTEKLHLIGWPGNGMQEHPDAWQRRKETAKALDQNVDHVMLEVDRAMADTLGSMGSLRHLTLTDFACTPGLVQAITQLSQNRVLVAITATVGDNAAPSLNLTLAQFRECQSKHLHRATFQWGAAEPPRQRPMTRQQKAFLQIR